MAWCFNRIINIILILELILRHRASFRGDVVFFTMHTVHGSTCNCSLAAWMLQLIQWAAGVICLNMCINMYMHNIYIYICLYIYICIHVYLYTYMRASPKIYLWCFSRDMHDETYCILQLIMQWVWSWKFCTPFKEAVSLQHIEHSSKHAVFFLKKCIFLQEIIQPSLNHTVFLSKHQIPAQYAVCH